jgi:hypothetical protein
MATPMCITACMGVIATMCLQCLRTMDMHLVNLSEHSEYGTLGGAVVPTCRLLSSNTSGTCWAESENVFNSVIVQCRMGPSRYVSSVAAICLVMATQLTHVFLQVTLMFTTWCEPLILATLLGMCLIVRCNSNTEPSSEPKFMANFESRDTKWGNIVS